MSTIVDAVYRNTEPMDVVLASCVNTCSGLKYSFIYVSQEANLTHIRKNVAWKVINNIPLG